MASRKAEAKEAGANHEPKAVPLEGLSTEGEHRCLIQKFQGTAHGTLRW
jgi:hypothetical protein